MSEMHAITTATPITTAMINEVEMALMAARKEGEVIAFVVPYGPDHTAALAKERRLIDRLRERGLTIKVTTRRAAPTTA